MSKKTTSTNKATLIARIFALFLSFNNSFSQVLEIKGNNTVIANGDTTPSTGDFTNFGSVPSGNKFARTFILKNTRTSKLNFPSTATSVVLSGTETDLKSSGYTFTAKAGVNKARFYLKYHKTLGITEQVLDENNVLVYKSNGAIHIQSGITNIANVQLFDISGRFIFEKKNIKSQETRIENGKLGHQIIVVKIILENQKVVSKKIEN